MISETKGNKGIALLLALFSLLFISLLVVAFLDTVTIDQQIATNQIKDMQASFLADAGVEYAVYKLKASNSYDTDTLDTGSYKVGIPVGGTLPKTVTCTGTVGTFNRSLEVVISGTGSSVKIDNWKELE